MPRPIPQFALRLMLCVSLLAATSLTTPWFHHVHAIRAQGRHDHLGRKHAHAHHHDKVNPHVHVHVGDATVAGDPRVAETERVAEKRGIELRIGHAHLNFLGFDIVIPSGPDRPESEQQDEPIRGIVGTGSSTARSVSANGQGRAGSIITLPGVRATVAPHDRDDSDLFTSAGLDTPAPLCDRARQARSGVLRA